MACCIAAWNYIPVWSYSCFLRVSFIVRVTGRDTYLTPEYNKNNFMIFSKSIGLLKVSGYRYRYITSTGEFCDCLIFFVWMLFFCVALCFVYSLFCPNKVFKIPLKIVCRLAIFLSFCIRLNKLSIKHRIRR